MNEILLAGVNEYIGSFLYSRFHKDYSITALDYSKGAIEENFFPLDLSQGADVETFAEKSPKCDVLIFLVGLAHKKGKGKELDEFRRINKQTLVNLLSILKEKDKLPGKIIFASTISVYGEKINQNVYNEDSEKNPFSPYAVTKLEAEEYLLDKYAYKSWILRFAPVYSFDFLLNIKRRTRIGGRFFRVGKGISKLSLCNIHNITVAVEAIIKGEIPSGVYNLSDTKPYSYNDLLVWQSASFSLWVPKLFVKILYHCSMLFSNIFLQENSIKLLTDNIYPNAKIRAFVKLPYSLNDMNLKQSNNL